MTILNLKTKTPMPNDNDFNIEDDLISFDMDDFDFEEDTKPSAETTKKLLAANKSAKETLIEFLRNCQMNEPYQITFTGNYMEAQKYIQRMRVELSRFRAQLIKMNQKLNHFYILTKSIVVESDSHCTITLVQAKSRKQPKVVDQAIDDVFDFLVKK